MSRFSMAEASHRTLIFALILISYVFLMFGNGIVSLTHPDEVFYTQTAKEMITHQSWMTPYIFDEPQFEKPVLFFWLLKSVILTFGMTPFAARFWPAFFGMLGVCFTYGLAWMLFGKKRTAFLSGLALTTSFIYIALSRAVLTDMVFSIWVVISIAFFYYGYRYPQRKTLGILLGFVFAGIAVLTKGLLGICFPMAVLGGYLLFKRDLKFLKCWAALWGLALFAVIAVPWHVLMVQKYGQEFIQEYVFNVHMRRLFVAEHRKCDTWYFYPGLLFGGMMPWLLFLFPAWGEAITAIRKKNIFRDPYVFLLFWIGGILIFVQPAHSKLASYVFPAFPAVAIVLGHYLSGLVDRPLAYLSLNWGRVTGFVMAGLLAVVCVLVIVFAGIYKEYVVDMFPVYVFSGLVLVSACCLFLFALKRQYAKMPFAVCGVSLALLTTLLIGRPYAEPWVSCERITREFKEIDTSDSVVLASKFYVRGARFYTDRDMAVIDINGEGFYSPHPIPFLNTDEKVVAFLETQLVTYGIVKEGNVKDLRRITRKGGFRMEELREEGGKYIVKIMKIK